MVQTQLEQRRLQHDVQDGAASKLVLEVVPFLHRLLLLFLIMSLLAEPMTPEEKARIVEVRQVDTCL